MFLFPFWGQEYVLLGQGHDSLKGCRSLVTIWHKYKVMGLWWLRPIRLSEPIGLDKGVPGLERLMPEKVREGRKARGEEVKKKKKEEAGRQRDFHQALSFSLWGRSATFPERGSKSSRDFDLWRFTPFPSVRLLAESADWLQQRISHQCSLIVFCKQNACCLVTFHLSLTFSESYCYQIRFTLSSCDYCNLLNPGVHPSGKRKVGCVSGEHGYPPDL